MPAATTAPDPTRDRLYAALTRRNRMVGVLRVAVPVAGGIVLAVVLGGIVLDNLREQFGFASLRIDRDNLVVDTPKVTGTDDEGTLYAAMARVAKVRIGSTDVVDMIDAVFTMTPLDGAMLTASTPAAALQASSQTLTAPGIVAIAGDDGLEGTVEDLFVDVLNWQMQAHGAVDLTFPDGTRVEAQGMVYDGNAKAFTFTQATVTLVETPGDEPAPTGEATP